MSWKGTLIRGLIWAVSMMLIAYLLGIEWNWRVLVLCIMAGIIDAIAYADYSEAKTIWERTANK